MLGKVMVWFGFGLHIKRSHRHPMQSPPSALPLYNYSIFVCAFSLSVIAILIFISSIFVRFFTSLGSEVVQVYITGVSTKEVSEFIDSFMLPFQSISGLTSNLPLG